MSGIIRSRIYKNCELCRKEFFTIPSRVKMKKGKYCSKECYLKVKSSTKILKECLICKKGFKVNPFRKNSAKYCSVKCYPKFGKDNPFYNKTHTLEYRIKKSSLQQGISVKEWNGFQSSLNNILRNSKEYKRWREAVFRRDKYTCVWCGQIGGELNADHIKTWALYPELRFNPNNGRTLCLNCHKQTPSYLNSNGRNQYVQS